MDYEPHPAEQPATDADSAPVRRTGPFVVEPSVLVRDVVFPLALPSILTGLRFALGVSVLALIAAEQINSSAGLGYLMIQAQQYLQADVLVVCIVIYAALGLLADILVRVAERFLMPWRASVSR